MCLSDIIGPLCTLYPGTQLEPCSYLLQHFAPVLSHPALPWAEGFLNLSFLSITSCLHTSHLPTEYSYSSISSVHYSVTGEHPTLLALGDTCSSASPWLTDKHWRHSGPRGRLFQGQPGFTQSCSFDHLISPHLGLTGDCSAFLVWRNSKPWLRKSRNMNSRVRMDLSFNLSTPNARLTVCCTEHVQHVSYCF